MLSPLLSLGQNHVELSTSDLSKHQSATANQISMWGIYIGMSETEAQQILKTKPNVYTEQRNISEGRIVINVLDAKKKTEYDLFSIVLKNGKVSGFSIFKGGTESMLAFNKQLIDDVALQNDQSSIYTSFLIKPDSVFEKQFDKYSGVKKMFFKKKGIFIEIRSDLFNKKNTVSATFQ